MAQIFAENFRKKSSEKKSVRVFAWKIIIVGKDIRVKKLKQEFF